VWANTGDEEWPLFFEHDLVRFRCANVELISARKWEADVIRGRQNAAASNELTVQRKALFACEPIARLIDAMLLLVADFQCELHGETWNIV